MVKRCSTYYSRSKLDSSAAMFFPGCEEEGEEEGEEEEEEEEEGSCGGTPGAICPDSKLTSSVFLRKKRMRLSEKRNWETDLFTFFLSRFNSV